MAVNWIASLKYVPWSKVISMTPAIVESGGKLWDRISNRQAQMSTAATSSAEPPPPPAEALAALDIRVGTLEKQMAQLREETVSSFDVVRSIVDQHSQIVHAVDVLLVRTRLLLRVCILLGAALAAVLVLALSR